MSTKNLDDAHTVHSYARLHNPALTSLGVTVASVAMNRLDGNVVLATAVVKNPDMLATIRTRCEDAASTSRLSKTPAQEIRRAS